MGIVIANYLGSSANGALAYPTAIITFFLAASALGLDAFVTREILRKPKEKNKLLGTAFRLRLFAGIAVLPFIYGCYFLIQHYGGNTPPAPFQYILIVSFVCIIQAVNIIDSYFQAQVQGKKIMIVLIAANLVSALLKLVLVLCHAPLVFFIWAILADALFLAVGYISLYQRSGERIKHWRFDPQVAKDLIRNGWPLAFSAILVTLYMKIDQVMIGSYLGSQSLGIYSTVVTFSESWYFIPIATVNALFPAIMNAKKDDPLRYKKRMQNLYDLMSFISVAIALLMTFAAPLIYKIILKPEYAYGAEILSIHIWAGIFVFLGSASGQFLIAEGYMKLSLLRTAVGAVVNILLNALWIPLYGIKGAAFATLIAYAVATFFILLVPKTQQQGLMMIKSIFQINLFQKIVKS